jgi:hypothetical protein
MHHSRFVEVASHEYLVPNAVKSAAGCGGIPVATERVLSRGLKPDHLVSRENGKPRSVMIAAQVVRRAPHLGYRRVAHDQRATNDNLGTNGPIGVNVN